MIHVHVVVGRNTNSVVVENNVKEVRAWLN